MADQAFTGRSSVFLGRLLLAAFGVAAISQARVHLVAGPEIEARARASGKWDDDRVELARRGTIYSADGMVLAQSSRGYTLGINYSQVPKSKAFFLALSEASGIPAMELSVPAYTDGKPQLWKRPFSDSVADRIRRVRTFWHADGVSLTPIPKREYPFAEVTTTLVGTTETDSPATGLEASQNSLLAGVDGQRQGMVDRVGAFLPMRMGQDRRAVHGRDLTLTIDSDLQIEAMASLRRTVETQNADQGVALVMDPRTGNLLAAASWVNAQGDQNRNGFNPATMAVFEPGSTFKILTLAEAIESGRVKPNDTVACRGVIAVGNGRVVRCAHGAHGEVDGEKAIAESCNVSAVKWAQEVGRDAFIDFLHRAHLFERTQIGLPNEARGRYNENDFAKQLQLANMSFGQAMNVTPVRLISAFSALANDGVMMPPRLIASVGGKATPLGEGEMLFSRSTSQTMLDLMEAVIEEDYGTGHSLRIEGYRLGGKTGTAQKLNQRTATGRMEYVSSFVGYVPSQSPRAVVLVMVDNPKAQIYGGAVAGPVFRDIAEAVIQRFQIPRTE